ncbi:MAG: hypothetical protein QGG39_18470, partial [Candidatus Poribacteria bacterium]|nr:hypothetical protein [Candidatus Poribacteria bacterium]
MYHLTFEASSSNPTDDDSNPLDLAGPVTFDFRTTSLPEIDFHASTIGTKRIRVTPDASRYTLPATDVSNTSSVVDLKLKFTESMNFDSLKDARVQLDLLASGNQSAAPVYNFRLRDLDGGNHASKLEAATLTTGGTVLEIKAKSDSDWKLIEGRQYQVTFDTTTSNPRDVNNNPLKLGGPGPLTFTFTVGHSPVISHINDHTVPSPRPVVSTNAVVVTIQEGQTFSIPVISVDNSDTPVTLTVVSADKVGGGGGVYPG